MTSNIARIWLALFVGVIFVGGIGAGVLAGTWLAPPDRMRQRPVFDDRSRGDDSEDRFSGGGRGASPERLISRLADELELTPEQRDELDALFDEQRDQMRSLSEEVREQFRSAQQELRSAIAEILTAEQQERFAELTVERRERSRGDFRRGDSRGRR
jgi:Spy/CpxP family protein refolding chaperone